MKDLRQYVILKSLSYPLIATDIQEQFQLCLDEIEQGESASNEVAICYSAIDELIEDFNKTVIN